MNDDGVGDVIRFGISHPAVRSIVFQPVTHAGRHVEFDPLTRLTNPDIIHAIAAQLPEGSARATSFRSPAAFPPADRSPV